MMAILDLDFIRLLLPVLEPDPGVTPRPPLAATFLLAPDLMIFPDGALELFKLVLGLGDFRMTGPFLGGLMSLTSCSSTTLKTGMFLAADTFLKLLAMEDFLLGVKGVLGGGTLSVSTCSELEDLRPAASFMAFSKTLTLSLMGDPV